MKIKSRVAVVCLFTAGGLLAQDVKTEVAELTVRRKPQIEGVQVFGDPGVELKVAVHAPGKPLLSVGKDACRLVKWQDDTGVDLAAGAPTGFIHWVRLDTAFRDEPTDSAMLEIRTKTLPGKGANVLELDAVVALTSASGSREHSAKVRLEKGTEVAGMPIPLKVGGVDGTTVELQSSESFESIREISFADADGKPIDADAAGSSSFGFGGKVTHSRTFRLAGEHDTVNLTVVAYDKMETVTVPLKLSIGVGLR